MPSGSFLQETRKLPRFPAFLHIFGSFPGKLGGWLSRTLYYRSKVHLRKAPKPLQEGYRYLEANVLNCHRKEYGRTCAGFEAPWSEWWGEKIRDIAPKITTKTSFVWSFWGDCCIFRSAAPKIAPKTTSFWQPCGRYCILSSMLGMTEGKNCASESVDAKAINNGGSM